VPRYKAHGLRLDLRRLETSDHEAHHHFRTNERTASGGDYTASVGNKGDVGRQDVEEGLYVAVVDGGEEPVNNLLVLRDADGHALAPSRDVVACPVGDLAHGGGSLVDRFGNFVAGGLEHLAQHEHGALGWSEGLEHGEPRH
jgi:hypothetical protein